MQITVHGWKKIKYYYIIILVVCLLYPNQVKKTYHKNVSYANRGMSLEHLINETNKYYLVNDIALIYKKPTPIAIKSTEYLANKIKTTGYLQAKSTLDYVGLYQGKYLDFDAKSTLNKTSLPLNNIHDHQLKHMRLVIKHQGISFLLIEIREQIYLLTGEDLLAFIDHNQRKSIPYDYILNKGHLIKIGLNPSIDYLKIIKNIYF